MTNVTKKLTYDVRVKMLIRTNSCLPNLSRFWRSDKLPMLATTIKSLGWLEMKKAADHHYRGNR